MTKFLMFVSSELFVVLPDAKDMFDVVLLFAAVDFVLTIFDVVLLIDDLDELLELGAVVFLAIGAMTSWFLLDFPSCDIMSFHAKSCPVRQNHAISGHGIAWMSPPTLVDFVGLPNMKGSSFCWFVLPQLH